MSATSHAQPHPTTSVGGIQAVLAMVWCRLHTDAGDLTNVAAVLNWMHFRVYSLEPGDTVTADTTEADRGASLG